MEVRVSMQIIEGHLGGRYHGFDLLGFYPGKAKASGFKKGEHWLEIDDDRSALPVAHLMERAFKLDAMVVYKKPDWLTQRLLKAYREEYMMKAIMYVHVKSGKAESVNIGRYSFEFFVNKMSANQSDKEGNKWETMELLIIDKTEDMGFAE